MSLTDSKPVLSSLTVWSGIGTIVGAGANTLGYHLTNTDISTIVNDISQIWLLCTGLATIYFRIKATRTLTPIGAKIP